MEGIFNASPQLTVSAELQAAPPKSQLSSKCSESFWLLTFTHARHNKEDLIRFYLKCLNDEYVEGDFNKTRSSVEAAYLLTSSGSIQRPSEALY